MKLLRPLMILTLLASSPLHAEADSPHDWFETQYAPLWADKPAENIRKIADFYEREIITFETDGSVSTDNRAEWLTEPMKEWLLEGWLKAEMTALSTTLINSTTATFTSRWLDTYKGGEQEISCGWYLAHLRDGQWRFAAYAEADCDKAGF
ncbi:MAG: hypothetical protein AAF385_13395 [Pseudomonadota bacterium]